MGRSHFRVRTHTECRAGGSGPIRVDAAAAAALAWDAEARGLWADPDTPHCSGARGRDGKAGIPGPHPQLSVWRDSGQVGWEVMRPLLS